MTAGLQASGVRVGLLQAGRSRLGRVPMAYPRHGMRVLAAAYALLVALVCLALVITPASILDGQGMPETAASWSATAAAQENQQEFRQDPHPVHAYLHAGEAAWDQDRASPDAHPAHHCCHSHVVPAQGAQRPEQAIAHHLTYLASRNDGLSLHPGPLLRPPRI